MNQQSNNQAAEALVLPQPYLLFLGDNREPGYAKTALGLRDWAGDLCIGEYKLDDQTSTAGNGVDESGQDGDGGEGGIDPGFDHRSPYPRMSSEVETRPSTSLGTNG